MSGSEFSNVIQINGQKNIEMIFYLKRSLGCVLYEMKNLDFAFPNGQKNNPDLPDLKKSGIFKSVLEK